MTTSLEPARGAAAFARLASHPPSKPKTDGRAGGGQPDSIAGEGQVRRRTSLACVSPTKAALTTVLAEGTLRSDGWHRWSEVRSGPVQLAPAAPGQVASEGTDARAPFNCGKGEPHHDWMPIKTGYMEARGYNMIPADLINRAAKEVRRQNDLGEYSGWCCGPNSALRACIMLGRTAPDVNRFIERIHTTNHA